MWRGLFEGVDSDDSDQVLELLDIEDVYDNQGLTVEPLSDYASCQKAPFVIVGEYNYVDSVHRASESRQCHLSNAEANFSKDDVLSSTLPSVLAVSPRCSDQNSPTKDPPGASEDVFVPDSIDENIIDVLNYKKSNDPPGVCLDGFISGCVGEENGHVLGCQKSKDPPGASHKSNDPPGTSMDVFILGAVDEDDLDVRKYKNSSDPPGASQKSKDPPGASPDSNMFNVDDIPEIAPVVVDPTSSEQIFSTESGGLENACISNSNDRFMLESSESTVNVLDDSIVVLGCRNSKNPPGVTSEYKSFKGLKYPKRTAKITSADLPSFYKEFLEHLQEQGKCQNATRIDDITFVRKLDGSVLIGDQRDEAVLKDIKDNNPNRTKSIKSLDQLMVQKKEDLEVRKSVIDAPAYHTFKSLLVSIESQATESGAPLDKSTEAMFKQIITKNWDWFIQPKVNESRKRSTKVAKELFSKVVSENCDHFKKRKLHEEFEQVESNRAANVLEQDRGSLGLDCIASLSLESQFGQRRLDLEEFNGTADAPKKCGQKGSYDQISLSSAVYQAYRSTGEDVLTTKDSSNESLVATCNEMIEISQIKEVDYRPRNDAEIVFAEAILWSE